MKESKKKKKLRLKKEIFEKIKEKFSIKN